MRILIIEDEYNLADVIQSSLKNKTMKLILFKMVWMVIMKLCLMYMI